jgi:hypothetical protein
MTEARPDLGWGRAAGILLAMFLAALGIDFFFNAGLLAHFYRNPGPALLSPERLMRRIPFGYASIVLTLALELWLLYRIGIRGVVAGARFGALIGLMLGVAGGLGLFSVFPLGPGYLAGVAATQIVEYTVAGALAGKGIDSERIFKLIAIGFGVLIVGLAAGIAMQAAGTSSTKPG